MMTLERVSGRRQEVVTDMNITENDIRKVFCLDAGKEVEQLAARGEAGTLYWLCLHN